MLWNSVLLIKYHMFWSPLRKDGNLFKDLYFGIEVFFLVYANYIKDIIMESRRLGVMIWSEDVKPLRQDGLVWIKWILKNLILLKSD